MLNVLAGTMVVAAICSYLGVFIVLRRAVFDGPTATVDSSSSSESASSRSAEPRWARA